MPGCLPDATPSPVYLGMSPRPEPTTTLFTLLFYNAALKVSKFTYNRVGWPCGSSKVRGCSFSIMDAHSHDHLRGSISGLALPRPCISSPGGTSGFDSPHPKASSHSLSSKRGGGICLPSPSCICLLLNLLALIF